MISLLKIRINLIKWDYRGLELFNQLSFYDGRRLQAFAGICVPLFEHHLPQCDVGIGRIDKMVFYDLQVEKAFLS